VPAATLRAEDRRRPLRGAALRSSLPGPFPFRLTGEPLLLALLTLVVCTLGLLPVARLLQEAVWPAGTFDPTLAEKVFTASRTWEAAWHSFESGAGGTLLSVLIGAAMALLVGLTDLRGKAVLVFCFMLPLMIPPQITALSWISLTGPSSALLQTLGLAPPPGTANPIYSREGIMLLLGVQHAPLVFLAVRAALRNLPRELIEAAQSTGAGRLTVARTVVLPLLAPALAVGGSLAFVSAIGNFGIPAMLGIPGRYSVLTTLIYQRLASFGPAMLSEVALLSLLIGAMAVLGVLLQGWILRRRDYRAYASPAPVLPYRLGAARPLVEGFCWLIIVLILVLPLAALAAASLVPAYGVPLDWQSVTLRHYLAIFDGQDAVRRAFANSFLLAETAMVLLAVLAVPLAYVLTWHRRRWLALLDLAAEVPYALPGIGLSIACILLFLKPLPLVGLSLYGTLGIILVAYLARFMALALRPVVSGFAQLAPALEEAAQMAGAGLFRRLWQVVGPLVAPTAAAGAILVFLTAFNELTVSALLWTPGHETLGVVVFYLEEGGSNGLASVVAVLSVAAIVALMLGASLLARRLPRGVLPWAA